MYIQIYILGRSLLYEEQKNGYGLSFQQWGIVGIIVAHLYNRMFVSIKNVLLKGYLRMWELLGIEC
jgi:hypothetical protein